MMHEMTQILTGHSKAIISIAGAKSGSTSSRVLDLTQLYRCTVEKILMWRKNLNSAMSVE